jgi:predicted transcriptional regulator
MAVIHSIDRDKLPATVKAIANALNLSASDIASQSGIGIATVYRILSGKIDRTGTLSPTAGLLAPLTAQALNRWIAGLVDSGLITLAKTQRKGEGETYKEGEED